MSATALSSMIGIQSCGDGTEVITPSPAYDYLDLFKPADGDNSAEAQARKEFYKNTGIYLIFDDYLGTYTDAYGNKKDEYVDLKYNINSITSYPYLAYDLVPEDQRVKVAKLIEKYYIPYITTDDAGSKPFSILPVIDLATSEYSTDPVLISVRCQAINVAGWGEADDATTKSLAKDLVKEIVKSQINVYYPAGAFADFAYSTGFKGGDKIADYFPEWLEDQNMDIVYNAGYLSYNKERGGNIALDYFPYTYLDFLNFLDLLFDNSEDEVLEQWSKYPKIIERYYLLRKVVESLGINLDVE